MLTITKVPEIGHPWTEEYQVPRVMRHVFERAVAHAYFEGEVTAQNLVAFYSLPRVGVGAQEVVLDLPAEHLHEVPGGHYTWDQKFMDATAGNGVALLVKGATAPKSLKSWAQGVWLLGVYNPENNNLFLPDWAHHGQETLEQTAQALWPAIEKALREAGFPLQPKQGAGEEDLPRSQKARGVMRLIRDWRAEWATPFPKALLLRKEEEAEEAWGVVRGWGGVFARPCPVRPRHGFVESRAVASPAELAEVVRETLAADPEGEVLVVPLVKAAANAIVTPSGVVIGPGHDGATSGKGALELPIAPGSEILPLWGDLLAPGEVPYVEAVYDAEDGRWVVTQYRSGPASAASGDFVPEEVVVKEVITLTGEEDLLEWEKRVREFPKGTVVYHPGGSLASHYGVHCVANGVPYIVSREPQVGEVLQPTGEGWSEADYQALAKAIAWAAENPTRLDGELATWGLPLALGVVHAVGHLLARRPTKGAIKLLGWAAVALVRYCTGASVGELRYSPRRKKLAQFGLPTGDSRDYVYEKALAHSLGRAIGALALAKKDFSEGGWRSGYGGKRWRESTSAALKYAQAVLGYLRKPGEDNLRKLAEAANRLLHAAHNNGWYLGKWENPTPYDVQDTAATEPLLLILHYGHGVLEIAREVGEADPLAAWKAAKAAIKEMAEAQAKAVGLEDFIAAAMAGEISPAALAKWLTRPGVRNYLEEVVREVEGNAAEPPAGTMPVYAQYTPKWSGDNVHIQIRLPANRGRDYGGVIDLTSTAWRAYLGLIWARGDNGLPSLNSADSNFSRYRAFKGARWDGDRTVWVLVERLLGDGEVWLPLPRKWA